MRHLLVISGLLLAASTTVASNLVPDNFTTNPHKHKHNHVSNNSVISIQDVHVIEMDEPIDLGFDVKQYLPNNFNPLEGKNDINWKEIVLIDLPEDINLGFDTHAYLPKDFNPLKGKDDINWEKISLIEIEEDVQFNFNIQDIYLKGLILINKFSFSY
ncbi:hypothetical protein ACFPH8_13310 [Bizionia hallyeonensis]|uniref:Uncharacterized protein n=1 Tax=Bizionia hallyeonensis TaxID=1123757 RepID=A0ABW0C8S0_9FLAO